MASLQPVGIDLGTTSAVAAWVDSQGRATVVDTGESTGALRSAVYFDDHAVLVGRSALKIGARHPERLAIYAKRELGQRYLNRPLAGHRLPPEAIEAYVLRQLRSEIEASLGPDFGVVITVPAYFDEARRQATVDAGTIAGLNVIDIVNEPTAAALATGNELGWLSPSTEAEAPRLLLVYDLGGGTFDVTLVDVRGGRFRTVAVDGDVTLGGCDWDWRLAELACERFAQLHGASPRDDEQTFRRLLLDAEETKHTLSARDSAKLAVEHAGQIAELVISRAEFEAATADLRERTFHTTGELLRQAGVSWAELSQIVVVGGATRMPAIRQELSELAGRDVEAGRAPAEAVARGAALFAAHRLAARRGEADDSLSVVDVNAHSLGIVATDPVTHERRNVIVLPRNTPLPAERSRQFLTQMRGQPSIALEVLEGESSIPEECIAIGRAVLEGFPPALPQGWPIRLTYAYQANGRLQVRAEVPGTENETQLTIERPHGMTASAIEVWRALVDQGAGLRAIEAHADRLEIELPLAPAVAPPMAPSPEPAPELPMFEAAQPLAEVGELPGEIEPTPPSEAEHVSSIAAEFATAAIDSAGDWRSRRRRSQTPLWVMLAGHLFFSGLGLAAGYWFLCWWNPRYNVLQLQLPGVRGAAPPPAAPMSPFGRKH